jgi:soluble lytic murein transglycosylase
MLRRFCEVLLIGWALLAGAAATAAQADLSEARQRFKQAYEQVDSTQGGQRSADSEALKAYPLYPYLQAARIRRALADVKGELGSVDQRAQTLVTYHDDAPVGRALRRVWLASLAERGHWPTFLEHYREDVGDEALECQSFKARIETGRTSDLAPDVARRWLTPRSLQECHDAFEWLRAQNALSVDLVEQRVRLALGENSWAFAREIAASLPAERAAPLLHWAALLEQPLRQIDILIATPEKSVENDALLAGWTRLARTNRDAAVRRYDSFVRARKLTAETASPYALALALALAWDRHPEAPRFFERVAARDLDDYSLEWRTRAAIWASDWKGVTAAIAGMSDTLRTQARWRYWAARAAGHAGDEQLARQLYTSTLTDDNFYSLMSAARLEQPLAPHPEKLVVDEVDIDEIGRLPALLRARELWWCGLRDLAAAEWALGYEVLPQSSRIQAIHLATRWGWHEQAIMTATQLRVFNDYAVLYPQPFDREVRQAAELTKLPGDLIYGVMRQESLYRADAVSSAGARGLLQMIPETARRTARTWKQPRPTEDGLFDPRVNVALGAAHLRTLVDRFAGQTIVALAGYNAGPTAARRWLPAQPVETDIWIENIPYNETRTYVQRILWHSLVFRWLKTGESQKSDNWLAQVSPLEQRSALR